MSKTHLCVEIYLSPVWLEKQILVMPCPERADGEIGGESYERAAVLVHEARHSPYGACPLCHLSQLSILVLKCVLAVW